ncbi:hypothetical protein TESG_01330 [Trichophyton tonsurans CBS 112818]|uniref:Uncharacterized protein n=1 Tax=Trichophyton tonsurans (strain CBS 112818) TaxID=647933 RepID=F2RR48_TRIT1|nr:hypothetical protein TESG_01330 [Trichophyton tonsurans CBS 112818]
MDLYGFSKEIFTLIIEDLVLEVGFVKAVRLRLVDSHFNRAILFAFCDRQAIDVFDPRVSLLRLITSPVLGRILLTKSRSKAATRIIALHVIATINQALDKLTGCAEQHRPEQHLKISTAIAADPLGVFSLYKGFEEFFIQQAHSLPWEESRIGHLSVDHKLMSTTMD